ncbi:Pimeloyl-ACP methyl ester carboxylesterase [Mameliella alba]|uniref:alpha/beta fold hydrolase n=1 Tax=Mameliella alba TaxID=561184 RepID=UPI00087F0EB9|nr:alpha/beta hydrolase [Mameliella alba]OWV45350.1 alpha/beta hydrolase [Mameliella alba]PTR36828.1 pimeloyl-ACP methyl ester carboxylesterase [Mameliella alba]GGF78229.1 alpha/beta hydrolase [Mameliella alba]SDD90127.1 Pimeloyl-ACP methyl ester carboxylesterase [Mameliella alba]
MTGWETKTAAGIEYLERAGEGEALVLLHGIGSQAASFTPLLDHIDATRRVIAWNAPGYGASAPLGMDWPLASDYARALEAFCDALGLRRVMLAGHSLGTLMGASFAAAHRDRVSRLVLASPALGHGVPRGGGLSSAAQARIDDLQRLGAAKFAALRAARLVHDPDANRGHVAQVQAAMSQVTLPGYGQAARMLASGRLLDDAERLMVPTDVIVGAGDVVTPPDGARRAFAALHRAAQGRLTIVPDAGHALYLQAPVAFAAALAAHTETAG